jgi:hypothetical protein
MYGGALSDHQLFHDPKFFVPGIFFYRQRAQNWRTLLYSLPIKATWLWVEIAWPQIEYPMRIRMFCITRGSENDALANPGKPAASQLVQSVLVESRPAPIKTDAADGAPRCYSRKIAGVQRRESR